MTLMGGLLQPYSHLLTRTVHDAFVSQMLIETGGRVRPLIEISV
jgi:hypothetical protein